MSTTVASFRLLVILTMDAHYLSFKYSVWWQGYGEVETSKKFLLFWLVIPDSMNSLAYNKRPSCSQDYVFFSLKDLLIDNFWSIKPYHRSGREVIKCLLFINFNQICWYVHNSICAGLWGDILLCLKFGGLVLHFLCQRWERLLFDRTFLPLKNLASQTPPPPFFS